MPQPKDNPNAKGGGGEQQGLVDGPDQPVPVIPKELVMWFKIWSWLRDQLVYL